MANREAHRPTLRGCGGAAPTIRGGVGGAAPHHKGGVGAQPPPEFRLFVPPGQGPPVPLYTALCYKQHIYFFLFHIVARKGFAIMASTGVVKRICNAGYLWIAPDAIGQHRTLVVHIKHCNGATVPEEGDKVMFDRRWNDTKGEYDIVNCKVTSGGGGTGQVVAFGGGDTSVINNT